jgi:hypothetical protein
MVLAYTLEVSCRSTSFGPRGPEVFRGELHRNSGLIIILSQSRVNIFNFVENAVMSVEQIVRSSVRRNGTHR